MITYQNAPSTLSSSAGRSDEIRLSFTSSPGTLSMPSRRNSWLKPISIVSVPVAATGIDSAPSATSAVRA